MPRRISKSAFTLIELLVVVAIIALLIGILIPSLSKAKALANKSACGATLKVLGTALYTYETSNSTLPSGYIATGAYSDGITDTSPGWGWSALLLPYISQDGIANKINYTLPISDASNAVAINTMVKAYICPADIVPTGGVTIKDSIGTPVSPALVAAPSCYVACVGGDETDVFAPDGLGAFFRNSHTKITSISDGPTNTILLGERAFTNAQGVWAGAIANAYLQRGATNINPGNSNLEPPGFILAHSHLNNCVGDTDGGLDDFSSNHPGGSNMLYGDGSIRFVKTIAADNSDGSYTQDSLYFQAAGTISNGDGTGNIDQ